GSISPFFDSSNERVKLHRFKQLGHLLQVEVVGFAVFQVVINVDIAFDRRQFLGKVCFFFLLPQQLLFFPFDLFKVAVNTIQAAEFGQELKRSDFPNAFYSRDVIGVITLNGFVVDDLFRIDAVLFEDIVTVKAFGGFVAFVEIGDTGFLADELHGIHVAGDDFIVNLWIFFFIGLYDRSDDVIGFDAVLAENRKSVV